MMGLLAGLQHQLTSYGASRCVAQTFPSLLTLGCASTIDVARDRTSLSSAKSCCQSIATLPISGKLSDSKDFSLTATGNHFDFGEGLAPFFAVSIDPERVKTIAALASLHTVNPEPGDVKHFRAIVPKFIFIGPQGERLADSIPSERALVDGGVWMLLRTDVAVPRNTHYVVVSSRLSAVDRSHNDCLRPGRSTGQIRYDECIAYPGGVIRISDWRGAIYGQLRLVALPTGSQ